MYNASENKLKECFVLRREHRKMAADSVVMDEAMAIYERCRELGIKILTPDDKEYPDRLYDICDYPLVLYYKGELPDFDDNVVLAVVGTRKASADGKMIVTALSGSLTQCGAIIISGGARGIDDAAHQGALRAGGRTISILGCGLAVDYNPQCEETRKRILENGGALISEFPPDYAPSKITFPIRNRLLSALSIGVIVGEAPIKSGALITARYAGEMGRDLFAIPGSVMSDLSYGANAMIRDGAKPVSCAYDVLEEYNASYPHRLRMRDSHIPISQITRSFPEFIDVEIPESCCFNDRPIDNIRRSEKGTAVQLYEGAPEIERKIYDLLKDFSLSLEELSERLSLPAHKLLTAVTELEINNIIISDTQRKYSIRKQ